MGQYHNKLDKKYFHKSVYVQKWEKTFGLNIKDNPIQYEIVYDTYNTFISLNNILFSLNYVPTKDKVENIIHLLNSYLVKYKNKIKKSYDSNCIMLYDNFENILNNIEEMKKENAERGTKLNLKSFEKDIEEYMRVLNAVNFDNLIDSKDLIYSKKANDKLPKKVNLKIIDDLDLKKSTLYNYDKQMQLNNDFIADYFKRTGINLNEEENQRYFIFDTLNRVKDINNAIVDYKIYNDKAILNLFNYWLESSYLKQDITFVKDITYINIFNKLKDVSLDISNNNIDSAFLIIKDIIEQFKELYERMS